MALRTKDIKGERHVLVVLKVTSKDAFGRPATAEVGYDDSVFKLEGGEEFITAWVPAQTVEPRTAGEG